MQNTCLRGQTFNVNSLGIFMQYTEILNEQKQYRKYAIALYIEKSHMYIKSIQTYCSSFLAHNEMHIFWCPLFNKYFYRV